MEFIIILKLVAILVLVVGNAFFVGSEVAITAARRSRIKQLADMGNSRAKVVKLLHDEPTRFYAVTQIGITLVSMALGYIGMDTITVVIKPGVESLFALAGDGDSLVKMAGYTAWTISFMVVSFLHVVGGELAPKVLAYHKSEQMSLALGGTVNFLYVVMVPIIYVMNSASNWLLILLGHGDIVGDSAEGHGHSSSAMSQAELVMCVNASATEKTINKDQGRMLNGVFSLDEETAQMAMVPKPDVHGLQEDSTLGDALTYFSSTNHRRYPVFRENKVVGVVAIKKLINLIEQSKDNATGLMSMPLKDVMRDDPFIVPASNTLSQVLRDLRANRRQFGIVVDEYGSMIGAITPENILSRLVGEYHDEFTVVGDSNVTKLKGSQWELKGGMRVADLEMLLNFPFPQEAGYVTVGGLVFKKIGKVPEVGDVIDLDGGRLQILEIDSLRITKVLFQDVAVKSDGSVGLAEEDSPADVAA